MDELFDTPALRVLRLIVRRGPVNMRKFTEASGHAPRHARALRERLDEGGFIVIKETTIRRLMNDIEIDVTPEGRKIGEHAIALEEVDERVKQRRGTAGKRSN